MECGYSAELQALKRNQRRRSDADECNRDLFFPVRSGNEKGRGEGPAVGSCGPWDLKE